MNKHLKCALKLAVVPLYIPVIFIIFAAILISCISVATGCCEDHSLANYVVDRAERFENWFKNI